MNPNTTIKVLTGGLPEEVEVSSQYQNNRITIVGLAEGVLTVRAKAETNTVFENITNGTLQLDSQRTMTILSTQISAFEFTVFPSKAYTVKIKQTGGNTEL